MANAENKIAPFSMHEIRYWMAVSQKQERRALEFGTFIAGELSMSTTSETPRK